MQRIESCDVENDRNHLNTSTNPPRSKKRKSKIVTKAPKVILTDKKESKSTNPKSKMKTKRKKSSSNSTNMSRIESLKKQLLSASKDGCSHQPAVSSSAKKIEHKSPGKRKKSSPVQVHSVKKPA